MRTLKIRRFQPRLLMGENSRHFIRSQLSSSYEIKKIDTKSSYKKEQNKTEQKMTNLHVAITTLPYGRPIGHHSLSWSSLLWLFETEADRK